MAGSEQLGLMFQAAPRKIYPVAELVAAVRTQVERAFTDVYVEGELSNYRPAESGHLYFTLKDASAQLRTVMWRTQARLLRFRPENGMQIIARGRITIYDERGDLQFQAEYLEPKGAGALQVAFEQLKAKLAAEGLFDAARKKPIPLLPLRIGLVTSPRGAAVQDILNVLRRRHESVNVLIYPVQVQGETAPSEVSAGIRYFNRRGQVDVIIVARGGGSFEDLFAFNNEGLARVIANSAIPVISAVGHETDFTISDFVADLRAPTPSAAAELVVRSKRELDEKLLSIHKRMAQFVNYKLLRANNELSLLAQNAVFARVRDSIARRQQRVDDLVFRMAQAESRIVKNQSRQIDLLEARLRDQDLRVRTGVIRRQLEGRTAALTTAISRLLVGRHTEINRWSAALNNAEDAVLARRRALWERLHSTLLALSPKAILDRGYAAVFDAEGHVVMDASKLEPGEVVRTQVARGEFTAKVEQVKDSG